MNLVRIRESIISKTIVREFSRQFEQYACSQVIIVGSGPSGLMAAYDLGRAGIQTLLIEGNNYLGGGFWIGGFLMNTLTFRAPAQELLEEIGIPYKMVSTELAVASGPLACARLIAAACQTDIHVLNMARVEDVIWKSDRVGGVVVNWSSVAALPRQITCVDPIALEAEVVIDATGHEARVCRCLERRGLLTMSADCGPLDVVSSEQAILERTGKILPGLVVAGMAVATCYGLPRMGPTFAAMLYSGRQAARVALEALTAQKGQT